MDDRPIGVFDSGFGGLTVARALIDLLPAEDIVYVGDSACYPYGSRSAEEIQQFAEEITRHLVEKAGVKMVVVACNSAASVALAELRYRFAAPIIGVIEPGLRAAAKATRNRRIGVIGTLATIESGAYQRSGRSLRVDAEIVDVACPGFVEFVERGETTGEELLRLVEQRLAPLRNAEVDTLLLGCTHYPFLARTISAVMGDEVVLVSSADETAFEVRGILEATGMRRRSTSARKLRFLSSGDVDWFVVMGRRFLGPELTTAESVDLGASAPHPDLVDLDSARTRRGRRGGAPRAGLG